MSRQLKKLLHDFVHVRLDPVDKEVRSFGGIILTTPKMARTGVVLQTGPGRMYPDEKYIGIDVQVGDRVAFFSGNMDTKQGPALQFYTGDEEAIIPETAILFVIELEEGDPLPVIEK